MATPTKPRPPWTYRDLIHPIPATPSLTTIATTPPTPPCPTCTHLLLVLPNPPPHPRDNSTTIPLEPFQITDAFPAFPALQASASASAAGKTGCAFCGLLRRAILAAWGSAAQPMRECGATVLREDEDGYAPLLAAAWDGRVRIHRARLGCVGGVVERLAVQFGPATGPVDGEGGALVGEVATGLCFRVFGSVDVESPLAVPRRRLPSVNALGERNIALIRGWTLDCKANHANACQVNTPWTPTRLLAVEPLRLVETADGGMQMQDDQRYAALSYARGSDLSDLGVQTSAENVEERKEAVDLADLPRAFRDAVAVCQALGIGHLWIDALCVLDDDEDRDREAAMMHKVFGQAEITIAATSAASPRSGFLHRNMSAIPAVKIGDENRYMILAPLQRETDGTHAADVGSSPWNQDAWALAEHQLSARVIHFARNKIYYECRRALRSEENDTEPAAPRPSSFWPRVERDAAGEQYRPYLYEQWRTLLRHYTARQLSRQTDRRLPLRGVAAQMAADIDDAYLETGALWNRDLADQLLWRVIQPGPRTVPRPQERNADARGKAPTWSWVRCQAPIGFVAGASDGALPAALRGREFRAACDSRGAVSLQGYRRKLVGISPIDGGDEWLAEMRCEYPWDLLVQGGDGTDVCMAHGVLDGPDAERLARDGGELMYLHVTDRVHPTGLVLALAKGCANATRIGVATIFEFGDLVLDPPFQPDSYAAMTVV
ncbi:HET-domain-containing protein [Trichocladium antarcticum]|uniref:HET-domain-containing protein n=1 Tax=Trichocladium antarcticum TaxID=1450529 RepID=A0AAN6ZDY3_9PEZI|nr:HET-domain-containing protein [Trichocladium antarcticum]